MDDRRRGPSKLAWAPLCVVVPYLILLSRDVRVAGLPFKVILVAATLVAWWILRGRAGRLSELPFWRPVLAVGIGVPLVWTVVALVVRQLGSSETTATLGDVVEEASRFGYLLLYLPLADFLGTRSSRRHLVWLVPTLALCAVTAALWLVLVLGSPSWENTNAAYTFTGIFGSQAGVTRVFFGNQVLLAPALAWFIGGVLVGRRLWLPLAGTASIVLTGYLAHTRGLWVALLGAAAVTALLHADRTSAWLARWMRTLLLGLIAIAIVASVLVLTDAVAPGFLSDASVGQRVGQASYLFDAWKASPVVGGGLGAALANGFVRAPDAPWSFELTYLQLLMQVGVLGVAVVLWPLFAAATRGARDVVRTAPERRQPTAAGAAGVVAVYVASVTNPYLLSSFGMVCLAVSLALVSAQGGSAVVIGDGARRRRWALVLGAVAVVVALTALEFAGPRDTVAADGTVTPGTPVGPLDAQRTVPLAPDDRRADAFAAAADGEVDDEPLVAISRRGQRLRVATYDLTRRSPDPRVVVLGSALSGGRVAYDVTRWSRGGDLDLAEVSMGRRTIRTRIRRLDGRVLAEGATSMPPLPPGAIRSIGLVRTSADAQRPDLYVIDRDERRSVTTVSTVSGASGFRRVLARTRSPLTPPPPWRADLGRVQGGVAAVYFPFDDPTRPTVELHVTPGEGGFDRFTYERTTTIGGRSGVDHVVFGYQRGGPAAYVVQGRRGLVSLVGFGLPG